MLGFYSRSSADDPVCAGNSWYLGANSYTHACNYAGVAHGRPHPVPVRTRAREAEAYYLAAALPGSPSRMLTSFNGLNVIKFSSGGA